MKLIQTGWTAVKGLWGNESGQGMVEYGLILALVSCVAVAALGLIGSEIIEVFNDVYGALMSRDL